MWKQLLLHMTQGDTKALARCISFVENEVEGYEELLQSLPQNKITKIIGITGPPGAGKSTITNVLIKELLADDKIKVAVLCIDPSSPFNFGALLGDRIRMNNWYNNERVFIRSLATRGSLGGLHPGIIQVTDLMKAAGYDYIIIETVGVGQSEVEIAGLADVTVVVLVPESGDVIQTMKAGVMEIADIFVVNKSDRPEADTFINNLNMMLAPAFSQNNYEVPVVKTIASQETGVDILLKQIMAHLANNKNSKKKSLLTEKALTMIMQHLMKNIDKKLLKENIEKESEKENFNLYKFIKNYTP